MITFTAMIVVTSHSLALNPNSLTSAASVGAPSSVPIHKICYLIPQNNKYEKMAK